MQARSAGSAYFYLLIAFSIVVLGYSAWMLYSGILSMKEGNMENFYYTAFISLMGIALALSSLMQVRKRASILSRVGAKVLTVALCSKCNFKAIRNFTVGDYVLKDAEKCQQCGETMHINQIYQEEPKKKQD
jgi:hypothetical protein